MSLTVGELTAVLTLDDSEFKRKMTGAERDSKGFGSRVGSAMSGVGKIAGAAALGGIAALAGGLIAGGIAGVKFNSSIEQTTIAMGTMLGSTSAAKTLIGDVTKMAAATPFEFPELADATKRLVAYGVSAKDAVPLMTRLGDISSALNIPLGEMSDLYGKMKISGKITMEDMNQMAGRGIPIYATLAKQMGVGQDKIRGLVEDGKVGFPDIEKAIASMTNKGGMFGGMMDKQSRSFSGLWSTIKDGVISTFGTALQPLFGWLVDTAMPKAIELINKFSAGFKEGGIMGGIKQLLGIEKWGTDIGSAFGAIASKFWDWIEPMIPPMLVKLGEVLAAIGSWVVETALPAIAAKLYEWGKAFLEWVLPMIPPMLDELAVLMRALGGWITDTVLPYVRKNLLGWVQAFLEWIVPMIGPILLKLGELLKAMTEWIVFEALPALVLLMLDLGKQMIIKLWDGLKSVWTNDVAPWLADLKNKVFTAVGNLIETLLQPGKDLLSGLWNGIKWVWDTGLSIWLDIKSKVLDAVGDVTSFLEDKGKNVLGGLWAGIKWVWVNSVEPWFHISDKITTAIGDVTKTLYNKGKDMITGLWNGMKYVFDGMGADIWGAIHSAWDWAWGKVKSAGGWLLKILTLGQVGGGETTATSKTGGGASRGSGLMTGIDVGALGSALFEKLKGMFGGGDISATRAGIVALAKSFLGVPYLWGGMTPGGFDCSGLVGYVLDKAGIHVPRTSKDQFNALPHVPFAQGLPGDLAFFGRPVHHVGMLVGNGQMIEAPYTGANVRIRSAFRSDLAGVGRIPAYLRGGAIPGSGPVPIVAHGGEYVLTKGDTALMQKLIAAVNPSGSNAELVAEMRLMRQEFRRETDRRVMLARTGLMTT